MQLAGIPEEYSPAVAVSGRPEFGDYQANGVLGAAKALRRNPRELALQVLEHLDLDGIAERVEIAGPGFINIHLSLLWLSTELTRLRFDSRLGVPNQDSQTVVVDYSAPNLAKEMHVGHLRSTIIGDAVVRVLSMLGHKVVRQNHMGDWGTQFGMLIAELDENLRSGEEPSMALTDLEAFYRQAKQHFDADPEFADRARHYVVQLQAGDDHCLELWRRFIAVSIEHSEQIYRMLNVTLSPTDIRPESAYNDQLAGTVSELREKGLLTEDAGAQVVFLDELADKNGKPSPVIIQKKDGGYLYATTDLAAIRYRVGELGADRLLYFIDDRQSLHMKQVFTTARKAGWVPDSVELTHCPFGTMMGTDGKPFKTRSGETVKLAALLDEGVERAAAMIRNKSADMSAAEIAEISSKVGIGAIKYADLSKTRTTDYVFNWDAMLSFEGNTAPYLQYAYTRICSIFRKAGSPIEGFHGAISIEAAAEKSLALKLMQFGAVVEQVGEKAYPHELCGFLFELATDFMAFYEQCPILKPEVSEEQRQSRLQIASLTARTLHLGLDLLGIETMERM
jgi:arginyl-tRNA synthetase